MEYRQLGRTDLRVSTVSFGAWAIGSDWGEVDDSVSLSALNRAIDLGVNFIDTADVYGDGRSEKLIGKLLKERKEEIFVATKAGQRLSPHTADGYNLRNLESFVDRSLSNLGVKSIDLLQLHCPPTEVFYRPEVFKALDHLKDIGKIRYYGVSVEKISEALRATEYQDVQSVQLIFNMLRLRPATDFFPIAEERKVGVLARVPLASGLLTGKITADTQFPKEDHRNYNRHGEAFDKGETFSGVDLDKGLVAVAEYRKLLPATVTMAQFALRWILNHRAVTCVIPGAKTPDQVSDNVKASTIPALDADAMKRVQSVYDELIKPEVHKNW
ncbi:MAG TPA: aldo/keto reductase [Candidatus Acidoferrales bacterium]|nr:aldo/keto reductase [Candidatus Acidoferrales bacterium]